MGPVSDNFPNELKTDKMVGQKSLFTEVWFQCPEAVDIQISFTVKNIRRFYGKITGNQLPVHFPLFFTGAREHFQESGKER